MSTIPPAAPLMPYTKGMKKQPLQPAHGGAFLINDTAANDLACQTAMAAYLKRLKAEEERRQAILAGTYVPVPLTRWNISDRH